MFFRHLFALVILSLFICSAAQSETLDHCVTLLEDATHDTSETGSIVRLPVFNPQSISGVSTVSNSSGSTPTLDVTIQSCRTSTGPCSDRMTFTQCTTGDCNTVGFETFDLAPSQNWYKYFRAVTVLGGTSPVYDAKVEVCY